MAEANEVVLGEEEEEIAEANAETFNVTFDVAGGDQSFTAQTVDAGSCATNPVTNATSLTKTGYTFAFWYKGDNAATATAFDFSTPINANTVLHAKWTAKQYDVVFWNQKASKDYGGHDKLEYYKLKTVKTDFDTLVKKIDNPAMQKTNDVTTIYKFKGWFTATSYDPVPDPEPAPSGTDEPVGNAVTDYSNPTKLSTSAWKFEGDAISQADITAKTYNMTADTLNLYAQYDPAALITFYAENGKTVLHTQEVAIGSAPENYAVPAKEGKTGKWVVKDSSPAQVFDFTAAVAASTELVPVYEAATFKMTYVYNGELCDKDGKELATYATKSAVMDGTLIDGREEGSTDIKDYDWEDHQKTVEYNKTLTESTVKLAGYKFLGWFTDSACTVPFDFTTKIKQDYTLTAKLVKANTVQFVLGTTNIEGLTEAGIGEATDTTWAKPEDQDVEDGKTATKPADPTGANAKFVGWYADTALATPFDFTAPIRVPTTVYAKFESAAKTYAITYDMNKKEGEPEFAATDTKNFTVYVPEATYATKPADPVRKGFTFKRWLTANNTTAVEFDFAKTKIEADQTLYADWEVTTVTITFDSKGGSAVASTTANYGVAPGASKKPVNPTRENYTFDKWFTDADCTTEFDWDKDVLTKDTTLYAGWKGDKKKVTFKVQKNSNDSTLETIAIGDNQYLEVEYGSAIDKAGAASNAPNVSDRYTAATETFEGWTYNGAPWDLEKDVVTGDMTLVASFSARFFTVTFDSKGGSSVTGFTAKAGEELDLTKYIDTDAENNKVPKKTGYELVGWYTDADCTDEFGEWDMGSYTGEMPAKNLTLYAGWETAWYPIDYRVDDNDHEEWQYYVRHGQKLAEPDPEPEEGGKVFVGWFSDSAYTKPYDFSAAITSKQILYGKFVDAVWIDWVAKDSTGKDIIVGKDGDDKDTPSLLCMDGLNLTDRVISGEKVTKPAENPTLNNYKFVEWYSDSALTHVFDFATTTVEEYTVIYGKFEAAETVAVSFYSDMDDNNTPENEADDSVADPVVKYVVKGEKVTAPEDVFYDSNMKIAGWYETDAVPEIANHDGWTNNRHGITYHKADSVKFSFDTPITANKMLVAQWVDNTVNVTFIVDGKTIAVKKVSFWEINEHGLNDTFWMVEEDIPEKEGYTFEGDWFYDEAFESRFYGNERITSDLTLYGKYTAAKYTVTFDPNGGTFKNTAGVDENNQKKVAYDSTVTLPTAEQMTAPSTTKTLAGWYTDAALTTAFDPATKITRNITLYAKYLNVVEITLVANGWTYDGTAHAATATATPKVSTDTAPAVTIEYKVKGAADTTYTPEAPKNVGTYIVRASVPATATTAPAEKTAEFTVAPAEITLTWPTDTALPFTGNDQARVPTVKAGDKEVTDANLIIKGKQTAVGTGYKATAELPATTNYKFAATAVTECAFSIVENTVAPSKVEVKLDPTTGLPVGLILTNADGSTTEVPITGNDIFEVVKKDNGDGTGTVTISPKAGSGYNFAPITTAYTETLPKATAITTLTAKKYCKLRVEWTPMVNVDGYQIQYNLKKKEKGAKTKTVAGATSSSLTLKKLTVKKRYYVRIRTYKTGADGKKVYSAWSAWKRASKKNKIFKKK